MDERVEIVEETIWESFAAYRASATATVLDTETIRLGITGVPYAGLNGVFRARRISASALEETLLLFRQRGVPMLWHIGPQSDPQVETLLTTAGLEFAEEEPGMFARLDTPGQTSPLTHWSSYRACSRSRDARTLGRHLVRRQVAGNSGAASGRVGAGRVCCLPAHERVPRRRGCRDSRRLPWQASERDSACSDARSAPAAWDRDRDHSRRHRARTPTGQQIRGPHRFARRRRSYRRLGFVTVCSVRRFFSAESPSLDMRALADDSLSLDDARE